MAVSKILRTIRFDGSDAFVFDKAAEPEEFAVSGAFAFAGLEDEAFKGKTRQAFANAFLGLDSFGRSTFVTVAEVDDAGVAAARQALADHFIEVYGAPDVVAAEAAAAEELSFAMGLAADAPINTVFTVRRTRDEAGEISEEFRIIKPPSDGPVHARIWTLVDDDA